MAFPDEHILERRIQQLHKLPWPIPAAVILEMKAEDFDALDMSTDRDDYWRTLNAIVSRVTDDDKEVA